MDIEKSSDILYYSKICLDEGAKKKNKKNLNYQKSNHKSNQKTFFSKPKMNQIIMKNIIQKKIQSKLMKILLQQKKQ